MLLSEIVETLFYRSGEYILGDLKSLNLDMNGIWLAFKSEIYNFQKYSPLKKRFNLNVSGYFLYDFTFDSNNIGYSFGNAMTYDSGSHTFNTGDTLVTLTLPDQNIQPGSVVIQFNGSDVAADDAQGNIVFSEDPDQYSGLINYNAGTIEIWADDLGSPNTVDIKVLANYVNPGKPPTRIVGVRPVGTMQVISVLAYWMSPMTRNIYSPDRLLEPRMFLWEYEAPKFYYSETGFLDVTAVYDYGITKIYGNENSPDCLTDVEISDVEFNTNYYILENLLLGRWLQTIGRSRRAFTFDDLPIRTDADTLVKDGTDIYNENRKLLYQTHDWHLAIRP